MSRRASKRLEVRLHGIMVGQLFALSSGRVSFTYAESWLAAREAIPLSLSLPLMAGPQHHEATEVYLWGLLPENPVTLDALARETQVSPRNPLALLGVIGRDCAGAVHYVSADSQQEEDDVTWLSEDDVGVLLLELRERGNIIGRRLGDAGKFSLAGAQPKTALLFDGARWGMPRGSIPTTHHTHPETADDRPR